MSCYVGDGGVHICPTHFIICTTCLEVHRAAHLFPVTVARAKPMQWPIIAIVPQEKPLN